MAKRYHMSPLAMGLLGGVQNWAQQMEKYNLLNFQNEARQKAYDTKYSKMADVAALRAQNNAMIAKLKAELPQKQYTQVLTDGDGNKVVSMGHMIADPQNPDKFIQHEDTRMSLDEYNKFKGGGRTTGNGEYTLGPGQQRLDASGNVIASVPQRPDAQAAIADRQAKIEAQKHADALERDKQRQERADKATKIGRVETLTQKDLEKFDNAGTDKQKREMLKQAGVNVPDRPGMLYGTNPPTSDDIADQRNAYEDAMRKKHAKNLGVSDKEIEEGPPAPAVEPSAETGDTTSEPTDHVPDIRTGKDGKQYKIMGTNPDGTIRAVPLAMHDAEAGDDNAVAMNGPDDEENEPSPDNEQGEGESDPFGGLIDSYQKQSDAAMAKNQDALASADEAPEEEDQGILAG